MCSPVKTRNLPVGRPELVLLSAQSTAHAKSIERSSKHGSAASAATRLLCALMQKFWNYKKTGLLKINPLLNWKKADVQGYMEEHNLPVHPLAEKGYRSVGCAPCTIAIGVNDDERAGRWAGRGKVECGLHTDMFKKRYHRSAEGIFFRDNDKSNRRQKQKAVGGRLTANC
jgi:3'-phosphoadenosine 5'-phosphosulfate sulfotransferase (PAPS reductase)/FAD synthetase